MATITSIQTSTHARHVASKVAADLKRLQRIYSGNSPSDSEISEYQEELVMLLNASYLGEVTYGYKRQNLWVVALKYRSINGCLTGGSDDSGEIRPIHDIAGSHFTSFLSYSPSWGFLTYEQRETFKKSLPFQRISGNEPGIKGNRSWVEGRNYLSGGIEVERAMMQGY